jgi:hypothetical protein
MSSFDLDFDFGRVGFVQQKARAILPALRNTIEI